MRPEQWQQVREILASAIALPEAERAAYLDKSCAADPELRNEVESLLDSHEPAGSVFLNRPADGFEERAGGA
jgi:eukaryotic-like serine/threonine-protein kinase